MNRRRAGLVPLAMATAIPVALLLWVSLLAAVVSLAVSAALVWLSSVVAAEARRNEVFAAAWRATQDDHTAEVSTTGSVVPDAGVR